MGVLKRVGASACGSEPETELCDFSPPSAPNRDQTPMLEQAASTFSDGVVGGHLITLGEIVTQAFAVRIARVLDTAGTG